MKIDRILEGVELEEFLEELKANDGYCPCKTQKIEDNKCMCKEFKDMEEGKCFCGLFIKTK